MAMTKEQVAALAERTKDAWSSDSYRSWRRVITVMSWNGWDERTIEAVLRSKLMRWAADQANGKATASDFIAFKTRNPQEFTPEALAKLVKEIFDE